MELVMQLCSFKYAVVSHKLIKYNNLIIIAKKVNNSNGVI